MSRLSGSMMNRATKVARFSRKKRSQMPNRWSTPVSMIFSSRPECCALWKANGSASTCSKKRAIAPSRRRCAMRSACSETTTLATMPPMPTAAQSDQQVPRRRCHSASVDAACALRQQVDDPAEQHRLVELQRGDRDVGEREHDRQPALVAQQPDDPTIDAEKLHLRTGRTGLRPLLFARKRSTVRTKKLTPNGIAMSLKS